MLKHDHAKRMDRLEHEALQTTDAMATLMDNVACVLRSNEEQLRHQVRTNLVELEMACHSIDANLLGLLDAAKQEFQNCNADAAIFMNSL